MPQITLSLLPQPEHRQVKAAAAERRGTAGVRSQGRGSQSEQLERNHLSAVRQVLPRTK